MILFFISVFLYEKHQNYSKRNINKILKDMAKRTGGKIQ